MNTMSKIRKALYLMVLIHRAAWFYLGYCIITTCYAPICLLLCPVLPRLTRHKLIIFWCHMALRWLYFCCGTRYEIKGKQRIPANPCVIISKHQSSFETFLLQMLFSPMATVLKVELTRIPLFGWAMQYLEPIVIDRKQKKAALQQVIDQGKAKIQEGFWILIFPEGTRTASGHSSKFSKGGFVLAQAINVPILPVAHNAGDHWPSRRFIKYPGTIQIQFGSPISTKQPLNDVMQLTAQWMMDQQHKISEKERQGNANILVKL